MWTGKQRLFVIEYIRCGNVAEAARAIDVGEQTCYKWMVAEDYPHVAQAIRDELEIKRLNAHCDAERVVAELVKIGLFNPKLLFDAEGNVRPLNEIPDEVAAAIKDIKVSQKVGVGLDGKPIRVKFLEYKVHDKLDALKQIAQHLGLLREQQTINNTVQVIDWGSLFSKGNVTDAVQARIAELERASEEHPLPQEPSGIPDFLNGTAPANLPGRNGDADGS
jgi:hypothetical protein